MADMTGNDIANILESFIRKRFQVPDNDPEFSRDVNLWEAGFVDSSGVVEMIVHLETSVHVTVPDSVLFSPHFSTINGMSSLLERLQAEGAVRSGTPSTP